jgi:hypothetical protein
MLAQGDLDRLRKQALKGAMCVSVDAVRRKRTETGPPHNVVMTLIGASIPRRRSQPK